MKFKIDENLPVEVADVLREAQYDACTVLEQHLGGEDDLKIATLCQAEERVLITLDTDFADIRTYPPDQFAGIIVLRLKQQDKPYVLRVIRRLLMALPHGPLQHRLWIVEGHRIRIRSS